VSLIGRHLLCNFSVCLSVCPSVHYLEQIDLHASGYCDITAQSHHPLSLAYATLLFCFLYIYNVSSHFYLRQFLTFYRVFKILPMSLNRIESGVIAVFETESPKSIHHRNIGFSTVTYSFETRPCHKIVKKNLLNLLRHSSVFMLGQSMVWLGWVLRMDPSRAAMTEFIASFIKGL